MLKVIDLVETVVFVFRKKNRQISFLHLYHHISTIYVTSISIKHFPGGMATFPIVVNSSVHVIMYTYYLLSSQGPKIQKMINPIKPYITIMQMVREKKLKNVNSYIWIENRIVIYLYNLFFFSIFCLYRCNFLYYWDTRFKVSCRTVTCPNGGRLSCLSI